MMPERHNHLTREIRDEGACPACDDYHAEVKGHARELAAEMIAQGYVFDGEAWTTPSQSDRGGTL
jgi:hypothetical protein